MQLLYRHYEENKGMHFKAFIKIQRYKENIFHNNKLVIRNESNNHFYQLYKN